MESKSPKNPENRSEKASEGPEPQDVVPLIQILFILDITGSMQQLIRCAAQAILKVAQQFCSQCEHFQFAIVGFRDFVGDEIEFEIIHFNGDYEFVAKSLREFEAKGGGDFAENLSGAVKRGLDLDWEPKARKFAFLYSDAPDHGKKFCEKQFDFYQYKDPTEGWKENFDRIRKMNINFNHYIMVGKDYSSYEQSINMTVKCLETIGGDAYNHQFITTISNKKKPHELKKSKHVEDSDDEECSVRIKAKGAVDMPNKDLKESKYVEDSDDEENDDDDDDEEFTGTIKKNTCEIISRSKEAKISVKDNKDLKE